MGLLKSIIKSFITPEFIGRRGEKLTEREITWSISFDDNGRVLKNLYVPYGDNGTTEIDILCITTKGLLVVESKNFSGFIFGNEKNKNWVSTLYAGKDWLGRKKTEKYHFYNPVWQNNSHINALKKHLKKDVQTISIIVFSERCELKDVSISSENVFVCKRNELPFIAKNIWDEYPDVLDREQINNLYDELLPLTNQSEEVKEKHVSDIEEKLNNNETCPRCGEKLILRTAKKGPNSGHQFWGCSNFPKCRFTKDCEEDF